MGSKTQIIKVKNISISLTTIHDEDYICLTDIAKAKEGDSRAADIIKNWIRNRATLEFLGTWEEMYNPDFKVVEFDHFKMQAGLPSFVLSPGQWIKKTRAAGMYVRSGRYGGTYAHKDIAFEFCSAINPVFKLYLIKEFQRLKSNETRRQQLEWDVSRTLAKVNYLVHTNPVKEHLIPDDLSKSKQRFVYADEADLLNFALFNKTASSWRKEYPDEKGNIRDAASIEQLVVLSNLESFNSEFIKEGLDADARLKRLNQIAIRQMKIMLENKSLKKLEG
jgi:KilA-N domain